MNSSKLPNSVSASIVLFNTPKDLLQDVYASVINSDLNINLYLIDNSPQPCVDHLDYPTAHYIFTGKNLGYGAGHNVAIRKIINISTFHFILNPDIKFTPSTIPSILKFMESDPTIGHVMPQIVYPDGEIQYLCKLIPNPIDLFARKFLPAFLKPILTARMNQFELRDTGYQTTMDVPYLSGCFMALRLEALKQVGLFDERFFMYPEDIDLTRRIAELYRTTYFPEAKVIHSHARESYQNFRMLWVHISNMVTYFNKWGWVFDSNRAKINSRTLYKLKQQKLINRNN